MNPAAILELLNGLLGAAPELLDLFKAATAGTPVSQAQVGAVLSQYGIARAVLVAAIEAAEALPAKPPLAAAAPAAAAP